MIKIILKIRMLALNLICKNNMCGNQTPSTVFVNRKKPAGYGTVEMFNNSVHLRPVGSQMVQ